jgi:hypothetical protein
VGEALVALHGVGDDLVPGRVSVLGRGEAPAWRGQSRVLKMTTLDIATNPSHPNASARPSTR